jgi:hypothetical protein
LSSARTAEFTIFVPSAPKTMQKWEKALEDDHFEKTSLGNQSIALPARSRANTRVKFVRGARITTIAISEQNFGSTPT